MVHKYSQILQITFVRQSCYSTTQQGFYLLRLGQWATKSNLYSRSNEINNFWLTFWICSRIYSSQIKPVLPLLHWLILMFASLPISIFVGSRCKEIKRSICLDVILKHSFMCTLVLACGKLCQVCSVHLLKDKKKMIQPKVFICCCLCWSSVCEQAPP